MVIHVFSIFLAYHFDAEKYTQDYAMIRNISHLAGFICTKSICQCIIFSISCVQKPSIKLYKELCKGFGVSDIYCSQEIFYVEVRDLKIFMWLCERDIKALL